MSFKAFNKELLKIKKAFKNKLFNAYKDELLYLFKDYKKL